jgi:AraC-like DNA-binding protein
MLNNPTALAMTLAPLKEALPEYDLDFAELARQVGIDPEVLLRPDARCPSSRIQRLWRLAAGRAADPLFGLRVGLRARPGIFHALGLGIVSSSSVLSALKRIQRYSSVVSTNGRFLLVQRAGQASLEARATDHTVVPIPEYLDATAVALCRVLLLSAGPSATPLEVHLPGRPDPPPTEPYRKALGCPVYMQGHRVALVFDAVVAARPVLSGNPELAAEADKLAQRYVQGQAPESTAERVRAFLLNAMPSGDIDQEEVARALNQSPSTLQRRLREEGTSYQQLLDATRRELAIDYLREGQHSLADITFLLGFSDQSNFTRAFRRWTGRTPREYLS